MFLFKPLPMWSGRCKRETRCIWNRRWSKIFHRCKLAFNWSIWRYDIVFHPIIIHVFQDTLNILTWGTWNLEKWRSINMYHRYAKYISKTKWSKFIWIYNSFLYFAMQLDLDIYFVTVGNRSIVIHQPNRGAGRFDCANIVPLFV